MFTNNSSLYYPDTLATSNFDLLSQSIPAESTFPSPDQALSSVQEKLDEMKRNQMKISKLQDERQAQIELDRSSTPPSLGVSYELIQRMKQFMSSTDTKLEALENQIHQLQSQIHESTSKQEQRNKEFSSELRALEYYFQGESKPDISSVPQFVPYSSSISPPSCDVPSFINAIPSQEETDAELAKKLQEEFNSENSQAPSQVPVSQPLNFQPPSYPAFIPNSAPVEPPVPKESCPICGIQFVVGEELTQHANSHFGEASPSSTPQQRVIMKTQPQTNGNSTGFFSKIFGAKPKPQQQQTVYSPYSYQQQQQPQLNSNSQYAQYQPQPVYVNSYHA